MLLAATILTVLTILFITSIGLVYLFRPGSIAPGFGFGTEQPDSPFHGVKGGRDVAIGITGLAVLLVGEPVATGVLMLAFATAPLFDMLLVLRAGGNRTTAFAVHGATSLVVAATGVMWLLAS